MKKIEPSKESKNIAIVSYGMRITLSANNVRCIDLIYLREYLLNVLKKENVDFVSEKTKKEKDLTFYKDIYTTDLNDYDEVWVYNCSMNAFGGAFKRAGLVTFEKLYAFNGDIIYFLADPKLPALDFSKYLKYKIKNQSYRIKCDKKDTNGNYTYYEFDKDILDNWTDKVWNRMCVAHSGNDYEKYVDLWNAAYSNDKMKLNENCNWFNVWLFEYYAVNEELDLKLKDYKKSDNFYDLVYFGNNRHNERNNIIKQLYDIPELRKCCIGFDPELENTDVTDYIAHDELFKLLGEKCLATVVVGDNLHNDNIRTARFFEAMLLDIIAFISITFDSNKKYVKNNFLKEFIYIDSKEDLYKKIKQLKENPELYKNVVELERKEILDSFGKYKFELHDSYDEPPVKKEQPIIAEPLF